MSLLQRQTKRIRSRSAAIMRRADIIDPISKEEPKHNKFAHLDLVDHQGFTPLHRAVVMKQSSTCQQLISKKVNVNRKTANGMTALHLACRHGDVSAVQVLLSSDSCDLNIKDKAGWTALHHCAINNHLFIAEMLLVAGADPNKVGMADETPKDIAPINEMKNLLTSSKNKEHSDIIESGEVKKCLVLPRKGCTLKNEQLGLEMEVPKSALASSMFFICRRIPATCCTVELGQSEVLISDIYEFWPTMMHFDIPVNLEIECIPINEGEEVILKVNDMEVPLFKEKQPFVATTHRRKIISTFSHQNSPMDTEKKYKFSATELGRMYVVSRLHKETYKIPLIGTAVQHSECPNLSVAVPKNGLSSLATLSFQVYPVAGDLISQMQKQYSCIYSMGPVCEVTHTDTEPITRRLVNMTIPLPVEFNFRRPEGRLVVVSGSGDGENIELIEKCHASETNVEFLTRNLTWKAAVTVSYVDTAVLADVCKSMRKYTRKRMHFIKYLVMYKINISTETCRVALVVVTNSNEMSSLNEWLNEGYTEALFAIEPCQQMMCEGEISNFTIINTPLKSVPVAFFSKQKCNRILQCPLPRGRHLTFCITSQSQQVLGEGEIYA